MNTHNQSERFDRQLRIPGFGPGAQEKLASATILIAGAGGLGTPAAMYLAAAGVGTILIADDGLVEASNLNRQILYGEKDIGWPKAELLCRSLSDRNPGVRLRPHILRLDPETLPPLLAGVDLVVDALDTIASRFDLNDAILTAGIPLVHAAVQGYTLQLMTVIPGHTACLRCLYGESVTLPGPIPVIGFTPGVAGAMQAAEAIKTLTGCGKPQAGELLSLDLATMRTGWFSVPRDRECPSCQSCEPSKK